MSLANRHPISAWAVLSALLALLLLAGGPALLRVGRRAEAFASPHNSPGALEQRNTNAFASILGEIRVSSADLMFIKTERYFHNGIAYPKHLDYGQMSRSSDVGPSSPSLQIKPLIPAAGDDFRGFLGELERQVKPWRDPSLPHQENPSAEILPWYRLMTLSDPHNIRGYMLGAMWLMRIEKYEAAEVFLREGLEKNRKQPLAFRLYFSLTHLLVKTGRLKEALEIARTGFQNALRIRPPLGKTGPSRMKPIQWDTDLEEDFLFLARYIPIILDKLGRREQAIEAARRLLQLAPEDEPLKRRLQNMLSHAESGALPTLPHNLDPDHDQHHHPLLPEKGKTH